MAKILIFILESIIIMINCFNHNFNFINLKNHFIIRMAKIFIFILESIIIMINCFHFHIFLEVHR